MGYASYFGIPISLITVSSSLLLNVAGAVLAIVFPVYILITTLWPFIPRSERPLAKAIRHFSIFFFVMFLLASPYLLHGKGWIFFGLMILFFFLLEFVFPLITERRRNTYEEKLLHQSLREARSWPDSLFGALMTRFGEAPVKFVFALIITAYFANALGIQNAKHKKEFFVIEGDMHTVWLAKYDDVLILQKYEPRMRLLMGPIIIRKLNVEKDLKVYQTKIGTLSNELRSRDFLGFI